MPTTIDTLLPAMLETIIAATELQAVLSMASTCRRLYRILIPHLYRHLCHYPVDPSEWQYKNNRISNCKLIFQTQRQWRQIVEALMHNQWLAQCVEVVDMRYAPAQWMEPSAMAAVARCTNLRHLWLPRGVKVAAVGGRWTRLETADTDDFVGWLQVAEVRHLQVGEQPHMLTPQVTVGVETLSITLHHPEPYLRLRTLKLDRLRLVSVVLRPGEGLAPAVALVNHFLAATPVSTLTLHVDPDARSGNCDAVMALYSEAKLLRLRLHDGLPLLSIVARNGGSANSGMAMVVMAMLLSVDWDATRVYVHVEDACDDMVQVEAIAGVRFSQGPVGADPAPDLGYEGHEAGCERFESGGHEAHLRGLDWLRYAYLGDGNGCRANAVKTGLRRSSSDPIAVPHMRLVYPPWDCPYHFAQVAKWLRQ